MNAVSFTRTIRRYAGKVRTLHNELRAERALDALPFDIRKDIGWPDHYDTATGRRRFSRQ